MKSCNFVLLLVILQIVLALDNPTQLKLQERFDDVLQLNQDKIYWLKIPGDAKKTQHLFITGQGVTNDPFDVPDIVVEKGSTSWRCVKRQRADVCLIDASQIHPGDEFRIHVSCPYECLFSIKSYLSEQYQLQLGHPIQIDFSSRKGFLSSINIPQDLNFTEVGITATIENSDSVQQGLYMYVNAGRDVTVPSNSSFQFKGQLIWSDGVGVFLQNGKQVKPGDTVLVFLFAPDQAKITLSAYYRNEDVRQIIMGEIIADNCKRGARKIYNLTLPQMLSDNYTISIKILKYSGSPVLRVSGEYNSNATLDSQIKMLESATYEWMTEVLISTRLRRESNLTGNIYLYVTSVFDSTYLLVAASDSNGFIVLSDDTPDISVLEGDEIDNYFYPYTVEVKDVDIELQFVVRTFAIQGKHSFGLRLCPLQSQFDYNKCIVKNRSSITNNSKDYSNMRGYYKRTLGITEFTFRTNARNCLNFNNEMIYCLFHLVFYRQDTLTLDPVKYQVQMSQVGTEYYLKENTPNRFRQSQKAESFYLFGLADTDKVEEVRFYITVISGDCTLIGSPTKRYPTLHDDPPIDVAKQDALIYTSISKMYYLAVKCFEVSLYTLTVTVQRSNITGSQPQHTIDLWEGLVNKYSMTSREKTQQFYIKLDAPDTFFVSVSELKGHVWFEVYPAMFKTPQLDKKPWVAKNNRLRVDNFQANYEPENEFIVVVHSQTEAYFTIQYSMNNSCNANPVGRPITLHLEANDTTCIGFGLNRHEDLDIILNTPGFELILNQLAVKRTINNESERISNHASRMSKGDLQMLCPNLTEDPTRNSTDCYLELQITSVNAATNFTLVVEYTSDEVALFDGMVHKSVSTLQVNRPWHFFFQLVDESTIIILLYPQNNTKFIIIGKVVEWREYAKNEQDKIYPSLDYEGEDRFDSAPGFSGAVVMLIHDSRIKKMGCSNCVLLMSVYKSNGIEETVETVAFDIEVVQQLTIISPGDTRLGYIENGTSKRYIFTSNSDNQRMISLSTFTQKCALMNLYSSTKDESSFSQKLSTSKNGLLIIPKNADVKYYIAEVEGRDSCFYHITEVETKRRVYQFTEGIFYDLDLSAYEQVYLIYYNTRAETFRVVPQMNYGTVAFQSLQFSRLDFHNVDELLDKTDKNYTFGGYSYDGSMKILKNDSMFCTDCYFLISVKSFSKTVVTLLIHYMDTPIPVRADKLVHDIVNTNESIQYVYYAKKSFNISVDTVYGNLTVDIKAGNKSLDTINVTYKSFMYVTHDPSLSMMNIHGNTTAYIVTVKANSFSSYTLQINSEREVAQIKYGIPSHLSLKPNHEQCIELNAQQSPKNINIVFSTDSTGELTYSVNCRFTNPAINCDSQTHIISEHLTQENINVELKSQSIIYTVCLKSTRDMNVSSLVSHNEVKVLETLIPLLIKTESTVKTYMSVYNPHKNSSIMIEAFECKGQVLLDVDRDYLGLIRGDKSDITFKLSKSSGHLVATVKITEGLYFLSSKPIVPLTDMNSLIKLKYSWFEGDQPYLNLDSSSKDMKFVIQQQNVLFMVPAINFTNQIVLHLNYTLYLSNDNNTVKAASQCGFRCDYIKSIAFSAQNKTLDNEIRFQIAKKQIEQTVGQSQQYYVTVVCVIETTQNTEHNNDEYRITYNTLQLINIKPIIEQKSNTVVKQMIILFGVVLALVVCGLIVHFKRLIVRVKRYVTNDIDIFEETQPAEAIDNFAGSMEMKEKSQLGMETGASEVIHVIE